MLDFLISPEVNFELEESRKILETKKVVYVLSSESSYDLTALKKCARKNSYTFPSRIKKTFFQLKGARRLCPWQRPRRRHPRELNELAHSPEKTAKLLNADVLNLNGDRIGSLVDIVFDPKDG